MSNLRFKPVDEPVPDGPDLDDLACRCPAADDQYLLEIDAGSVFVTHAACGKPPRDVSDMTENLQLDATPVQIRPENNCTGWHEYSCDCDFWAQITIPGLTPQAAADGAAAETLNGHLDREAKTWTHATGHVMDLSHGWQDCEGRHWHWDDAAAPHPVNGPYMRAAAYGLREPLDVILAAWGPIEQVRKVCFECDRSYLPSAGVGPWCSTVCRNLDDRHDNGTVTE